MMFSKYHGLGNDFIIVDFEMDFNYEALAVKVCNRYTGIGSDGLIVVKKNQKKYQMIFYNADGSKAKMCGNGIRCLGKYLVDRGMMTENDFIIDTDAGEQMLKIISQDPFLIEVNMGSPKFNSNEIGINVQGDSYINENLVIDHEIYKISSLEMGPLHSVIFVEDLNLDRLNVLGEKISNHPQYPNRTNVNFVRVINEDSIEIQTYERGVGLTHACGTGACASFVIGHKLNLLNESINVKLKYGSLNIRIEKEEIIMQGPSQYVCRGEF